MLCAGTPVGIAFFLSSSSYWREAFSLNLLPLQSSGIDVSIIVMKIMMCVCVFSGCTDGTVCVWLVKQPGTTCNTPTLTTGSKVYSQPEDYNISSTVIYPYVHLFVHLSVMLCAHPTSKVSEKWMGCVPRGTRFYNFPPLHWPYPLQPHNLEIILIFLLYLAFLLM